MYWKINGVRTMHADHAHINTDPEGIQNDTGISTISPSKRYSVGITWLTFENKRLRHRLREWLKTYLGAEER